MSLETRQAIGQDVRGFVNTFKKAKEEFQKDLVRLGIKVNLDIALTSRLQTMANVMEFIHNPHYGIEAKIQYVDTMITLAGMAWGRGGDDGSFGEVYVAWRELHTAWIIFKSQLDRFPRRVVHVERAEVRIMTSGDEKEVWVPMEVEPFTAVRMQLDSPQKVKIIEMTEREPGNSSRIILRSQPELEADVERFGWTEILEYGLIVLANTFKNLDVSPNTPIVIQGVLPEVRGRGPQTEDAGLGLDEAAKRFKEKSQSG